MGQYSYKPYGKLLSSSTPVSGNPFTYTAREDDGTGLYYYRARYYDPTLELFISQDPLGDAQRYVGGNPLSFVDPLGLYTSVNLTPSQKAAVDASINKMINNPYRPYSPTSYTTQITDSPAYIGRYLLDDNGVYIHVRSNMQAYHLGQTTKRFNSDRIDIYLNDSLFCNTKDVDLTGTVYHEGMHARDFRYFFWGVPDGLESDFRHSLIHNLEVELKNRLKKGY